MAAVYDVTNGEKRIYVDGQLDGTSTTLGGGGNLDADFLVGGYFSSGNLDSFPGDLDEVRIWGVARTEAEIQADMDTPLDGDEPGLLAYYRIDEGTGTVLTDAAGDIDGTFVSEPTWIAPGAPMTYPPPPPVCEQSLSATLDDANPAPGSVATFSIAVHNTGSDPATLDLWLDAAGPFDQTRRMGSGTVAASETYARDVRVRIPGNAPQGVYAVELSIGTYPDDACDTVSFEVTVGSGTRAAGGAGAGPVAFEVLDGFFAPQPAASVVAEGVSVSPNPFSSRATLSYALPEAGRVRLAVYDVLGREVAVLADGEAEAGTHAVAFDAGALAAGVYVARLEAGGAVHTQRITLAR